MLHERASNFLSARDFAKSRDFSEDTQRAIDAEVHGLVARNYERARMIIEEKRDRLEAIAQALLDRETLDGPEILTLMEGGLLAPKLSVNHAQDVPPTSTLEDASGPDAGLDPTPTPA